MKEGILIIDKPAGFTSHDIVSKLRHKFKMNRIGHAGTLDPLATGVLVILLGKSTKLFNKFVDFDKSYEATLLLGTTTDSADIEGKIIKQLSYNQITQKQIEDAFKIFLGDIQQVPPMVSAVKIRGIKLYQLARRGIHIERPARSIRINHLQLDEFTKPEVKFSLECSKGTYVRQLAEDVGNVLKCGACITKIKRTKVGPFCIEHSNTIENVNEDHIQNWKG